MSSDPNRNPDGTFKAGNHAASTTAEEAQINKDPNAGMPASVDPSRNPDGQYPQRHSSLLLNVKARETGLAAALGKSLHSIAISQAHYDLMRNLLTSEITGTFAKGSAKTNPDNFANRDTKEVQELAKEGGSK